jgi:hypothetical protein
MELEPIIEIFDPVTIVSEMASGSDVLVTIAPDVIAKVIDGDSDPKFATFVIASGWSKSNRLWDVPIFDSVHEQISKANDEGDPVVGYLGHIKPDDDPYSFPEIQFQWLRSALKKVGDKAHIFTKAYVLPETKARYYLKKGLAKSVSWYGQASQIPFQKGVRVSDFKLESIDLARPRKAGMSARLVGALTSEMSNGGNEVKPEEIASLQENELRAHNPALVTKIEDAAKKPLSDKVSEMEGNAEALKKDADVVPKLREILGIDKDADPVEFVKKMAQQLSDAGKGLREKLLDSILAKKFKDVEDKHTLSLIRRTLVSEMNGKEISLSGDDAKDEKAISDVVNTAIDGDDDLKALVSEMENAPPSLPVTGRGREGEGQKEIKPGYDDSYMSVRSRR